MSLHSIASGIAARRAREQVVRAEVPAPRVVTLRAVLLGLPLIAVNCFWITVVEVRLYTLDGTSLPLFITPIFMLFTLIMLNVFWRWLSPRSALTPGELLTIYVMLVISSTLAAHDMLQNMFGVLGHPVRFATPENNWKALWFQYLPWRLFVRDEEVLKDFYQGNVSPYRWYRIQPFLEPLLLWAVLILALIGVMLGVNILLRRSWTEHERLVFPIVQLPMAMTGHIGGVPFFRQKPMWAGFILAMAISGLNGIHWLYPSVPYIQYIKLYDLRQHITNRPWDAVGWTPISMYPFGIGLAFFTPLDLQFSCWFFYVARKLFQVVGAVFGWDAPTNVGFPFFPEQAAGGWTALGIVVVYGARRYFVNAWRQAWAQNPTDPEESRRFRRAFGLIAVCLVVIIVFAQQIGLSLWAGAVFFGIYFLLAITITRVRAELGTPHEIYFVNPNRMMTALFGSQNIGTRDLTLIQTLYWFNRGYRSHPMPNQLEAMKMFEGHPKSLNRLIWVIVVATLFGFVATCWANLHVTYRAGADAKAVGFKDWLGWESFGWLTNWINAPVKQESTRIGYMVGGFLIVVLLRLMRNLFLWWPLHPAGYALAVSYAMDYFWFNFFIAWVIKGLLVRYGGMRAHNIAVPFFLGLILGDYTMGSLWSILGAVMDVQTYKIYI